jgi:hypothetical protein
MDKRSHEDGVYGEHALILNRPRPCIPKGSRATTSLARRLRWLSVILCRPHPPPGHPLPFQTGEGRGEGFSWFTRTLSIAVEIFLEQIKKPFTVAEAGIEY